MDEDQRQEALNRLRTQRLSACRKAGELVRQTLPSVQKLRVGDDEVDMTPRSEDV